MWVKLIVPAVGIKGDCGGGIAAIENTLSIPRGWVQIHAIAGWIDNGQLTSALGQAQLVCGVKFPQSVGGTAAGSTAVSCARRPGHRGRHSLDPDGE